MLYNTSQLQSWLPRILISLFDFRWNVEHIKWAPAWENQRFAYAKTKTAKLISAFVFATWIVQYFIFLNSKFQASSHLQRLYSLVCVRPGQNPNCWFLTPGLKCLYLNSLCRFYSIHSQFCVFNQTNTNKGLGGLIDIISSPEPSGSQGELIVYPWFVDRRPPTFFKHLLL